jgi:hypothetical protein
MTNLTQCATDPASAAQFCRLWSDHVDALERHLSAKMWLLTAASVVLMAYPILRIAIPGVVPDIVTVLHGIVPDVVRTVISLI